MIIIIIIETDNKSDEQLKNDIKNAVDNLNIQKDSDKIRNDHINISEKHRPISLMLKKIFDDNKINNDADLLFKKQYFQKMIYNEWSEEGLTVEKIIEQMNDYDYKHIKERQIVIIGT